MGTHDDHPLRNEVVRESLLNIGSIGGSHVGKGEASQFNNVSLWGHCGIKQFSENISLHGSAYWFLIILLEDLTEEFESHFLQIALISI